jgi:hypothetical protein
MHHEFGYLERTRFFKWTDGVNVHPLVTRYRKDVHCGMRSDFHSGGTQGNGLYPGPKDGSVSTSSH